MKTFFKAITFYIIFLQCNNFYAQLNVSSNGYLYVSNSYLFVNQGINLNGKIYLRKDGQLLQGTASTANTGTGILSVYQEGTCDNYEYNYWCSPVGDPSLSSSGNTAFGITLFNRPTTSTASTPVTTTSGLDGSCSTSSLEISESWINKYVIATTYPAWQYVGSATDLNSGEGFTMKGTLGTDATTVLGIQNNPGSNQRYDFRGRPNNGNIAVGVVSGFESFVGNPYPSAVHLSEYLFDNTDCTGIAYFWEQDKDINSHNLADYMGGYSTYACLTREGPGTFVPAIFYHYTWNEDFSDVIVDEDAPSTSPENYYPREYLPIGQGFVIEGNGSGFVTMQNSYRAYVKEDLGLSVFERNSNITQNNEPQTKIPSVSENGFTIIPKTPVQQIRFFNIINNKAIRTTALVFNKAATDGVDRMMDAHLLDKYNTDTYFVLDRDKEFVIEAVDFDINKKIPIGFRNQQPANYKIKVSDIANFSDAEKIFIHDKQEKKYYNITDSFFNIDLPAGINNDRFEITFTIDSTLGNHNPAIADFIVLQNNDSKKMVLVNPESTFINTCTLYDVTGRLIFAKTNLGNDRQYEFSTASLPDGIYITKVISDTKITTTKINIHN
ncbi:MAG: T9SS type A sorting domain-containing protein [Flavobacterium sp.]|nr:T9SS type A sorting domain-containing protein [Flavobacterium sp.]